MSCTCHNDFSLNSYGLGNLYYGTFFVLQCTDATKLTDAISGNFSFPKSQKWKGKRTSPNKGQVKTEINNKERLQFTELIKEKKGRKKESSEREEEIYKGLTRWTMHVSYFADGNKRLNDEQIRSIKEREKKVKRTLEKTHPSAQRNQSWVCNRIFVS